MAAELTADVTRYISQSRAAGLRTELLAHYDPSVVLDGPIGLSYSPSTNQWTKWVLVTDDDPRAETFERSGH